jgi:hypothetical protein
LIAAFCIKKAHGYGVTLMKIRHLLIQHIMKNRIVVDNNKTFDPDDPMGWLKLAKHLYKINLKNLKKGKPLKP